MLGTSKPYGVKKISTGHWGSVLTFIHFCWNVRTDPDIPQLINRSQNHSYNPQKNRLISTSQASFSYDDEGQIKTKTQTSTSNTTHFSFDYAHRLTSQGNNQYVYDGVGNRIKATRNGQVTKYIYDAAGNLLAEANSANQIIRYYIYGHGMLGFIETASNQLYIYHHNSTGHTVAITDQSQNIVNSYAYDPYGNIMGESETIAQPFKYVGQLGVQAEDNGLYYMRARYYDAEVGRFISEDPMGFQGGLNLYAYVGGNPVTLVDPDGYFALNLIGAGIGASFELGSQLVKNGGDFGAVDWVDVVGMGVVGAVAPGMLSAGRSALNSLKASNVLKAQLSKAKAISRKNILKSLLQN